MIYKPPFDVYFRTIKNGKIDFEDWRAVHAGESIILLGQFDLTKEAILAMHPTLVAALASCRVMMSIDGWYEYAVGRPYLQSDTLKYRKHLDIYALARKELTDGDCHRVNGYVAMTNMHPYWISHYDITTLEFIKPLKKLSKTRLKKLYDNEFKKAFPASD